jgi:DNA repair exonuclease SbcCD ATPase subunit
VAGRQPQGTGRTRPPAPSRQRPGANRYGFSENFEIVDRLSGLPRGVTPLSGGETFLASLALALGLVELAQRGGGRLDALFLDEGASAPWTRTHCPRRLTP